MSSMRSNSDRRRDLLRLRRERRALRKCIQELREIDIHHEFEWVIDVAWQSLAVLEVAYLSKRGLISRDIAIVVSVMYLRSPALRNRKAIYQVQDEMSKEIRELMRELTTQMQMPDGSIQCTKPVYERFRRAMRLKDQFISLLKGTNKQWKGAVIRAGKELEKQRRTRKMVEKLEKLDEALGREDAVTQVARELQCSVRTVYKHLEKTEEC
jgi:predicted DNA-binding transcriptional regulator